MDREKLEVREVRERKSYQVGDRIFKTKYAAAKYEAWRMILSRYSNEDSNYRLESVKELRGMVCGCYPPDGNMICELHSKDIGYFSKLRKRLSKSILYLWR